MRLIIVAASLLVVALAMTPEEEACAAPLMKQLAAEKDVEVKKFVTKCFKMMNAGKKEEVKALVKKFDHDKLVKFMDDYMQGPCEIFRSEFENL
ncbi:hypothetical protein PRIPAC_94621 [Pristionchus pacificus]|uniref:Uncharacterized protein n=1 Tax=Pristionchus pacificus TaxID=54126 RepID=A0A454Y6C8_PRIPA|nr:hypothetical protein PRIPAC_94621 [Pristionchus pacificus]|eukprot:PDM68192.1 hypothetical protein PRIPAC_46236 [Pristionchus pacificus]